jgi:hypothetical protein
MRFNPITNGLFTDKGQFIKRLHCPYKVAWEHLKDGREGGSRLCPQCSHSIIDTAAYSEDALLEMMAAHPQACLQLNMQNPNIRITHETNK